MKKYYVKQFGIMFFAFIFAFLLAGIFIPSVNEAFAVDEGLNFISNCPTETTEYK